MPLPDALPLLEDGPVRLRGFRYDDVPLVLEAATDPAIPAITTVPADASEVGARAFVDRQQGRLAEKAGCSFAIADAASDEAVGQIGIWVRGLPDGRASIGYWVGPSQRGRGWAGRALRVVSDWGRSLPGLHRLELYVEPGNVASWRTAERVGYRREGLLRGWQEVGGVRRDMYMYSLLPGDVPPPPGRGRAA